MDYQDLVAASQPEALRAALAANAEELRHAAQEHHGGELASIRQVTYKGHEIVVRTTYEITVDGQPFNVHLTIGNDGRVHYHGLPTRDFSSVIGLVEKAIDVFGDEFGPGSSGQPIAPEPDPHHPDHAGHGHSGHDHSGGA
ncbi:MAG: hypothetical protein ACRDTC_02675 [Pseudonocardiaceae bacterium]